MNTLKNSDPFSENTLDQIISYQNPDVISRFSNMFEIEDEEIEDIFTETKKFLFISRIEGVFIPDDLLILDEMWHNFILFTSDYQKFCLSYFQKFLHHLPATQKDKEIRLQRLQENPDVVRQEYTNKLRYLITVTYDYFGESTVRKWFQVYPEKYSKENILKLRKV